MENYGATSYGKGKGKGSSCVSRKGGKAEVAPLQQQ
jgi:hypothetical protein